ncbi:GNAT family N-acetyltransferase [Streptomyces klenkii]
MPGPSVLSGRTWRGPAPAGAPSATGFSSLACPLFPGSRCEDIAVAALPQERGRGLATACVRALCADITARGRIPFWSCSRDNYPGRHLVAKNGVRLVHAYVHYAVGSAARCPGNAL